MYLIQILLPLYDNQKRRIPAGTFTETAQELTERFGGLTAYARAPAKGVWKKRGNRTTRDDLVVYEVMSKKLERRWWRGYRGELEKRYRQERIVIRSQVCEEL